MGDVLRHEVPQAGHGATIGGADAAWQAIGSPFAGRHVAVLAAHPDDETIGLAAQLGAMRRVCLVHLSDGAPSRRAARAHGFADRAAYRAARAAELAAALGVALAGSPVRLRRVCLHVPDGLAPLFMGPAAAALADVLRAERPEVLVTHPYEGGHPDHDAAAWAARAALRGLPHPPELWEMACYHAGHGGAPQEAASWGRFLGAGPVHHLVLPDVLRARRAAALACFASQARTLREAPAGWEACRPAPGYDWTRPPHPGPLLYEARRRAFTGRHWRRLAARADPGRAPPCWRLHAGAALWSAWLVR